MSPTEKLYDKIRKLSRLSESSNPHEAALAAQRMQEMLDKHGIEMAEIEASDPDALRRARDTIGETPMFATGRLSIWKSRLAATVARHNGCVILIHQDRGKRTGPYRRQQRQTVAIVGRKEDAQTVTMAYNYLVSEIDRLTSIFASGKGRNWANNFRLGVIDAIAYNLREAHIRAEREARERAAGHALIRLEHALEIWKTRTRDAEAWIDDNLNNVKQQKNVVRNHNNAARRAGQVAGMEIDINGHRGIED